VPQLGTFCPKLSPTRTHLSQIVPNCPQLGLICPHRPPQRTSTRSIEDSSPSQTDRCEPLRGSQRSVWVGLSLRWLSCRFDSGTRHTPFVGKRGRRPRFRQKTCDEYRNRTATKRTRKKHLQVARLRPPL
jgi:hypothetical protein